MFSEACVKNSVHRGCVQARPGGGCPGGCPGPGPGPGGCLPGGGVQVQALRQTPTPQQIATAADGTHPTGMHACFDYMCKKYYPQIVDSTICEAFV